MRAEALLLVLWVLVGAGWLVAHVIVLGQALRSTRIGAWRWLALLQAPAPFVAWAGGARTWPVCWVALAGTYLVLRTMG